MVCVHDAICVHGTLCVHDSVCVHDAISVHGVVCAHDAVCVHDEVCVHAAVCAHFVCFMRFVYMMRSVKCPKYAHDFEENMFHQMLVWMMLSTICHGALRSCIRLFPLGWSRAPLSPACLFRGPASINFPSAVE